ncbi:DUF1365 domain-containing protein [Pseudomonas sp. SWRI92]|uniref:DUF1365 domain-containing protein n=1 Tax=Pseudomonas marvdashtae TaxID=2745500 RepID=A0A923JNZ7_9PSED|nr:MULTISPECIES: DUF1365 domain-containing protein [Pseudomonas]MBC3372620.1 DUF1365 domain-containing protein [Pseudomonas sp. SWRI92]MBV4551822.1 DUF1365 domain-containing protein [Pseudomonas marvdashtae]
MNSSLCYGWIDHRRQAPRAHAFRYPIGMFYLDLAEQEQVLGLSRLLRPWRAAPLCWRERDYLPALTRQGMALTQAVRDTLQQALGSAPQGAIHLLTQPRSWGLSFNPVSFYFCHELDGRLAAILCEVRNTPWRERHHYVLPVLAGEPHTFRVAKSFHVSPFLPRDMDYHMRFLIQDSHIRVRMENWRAGHKVFEADLALQRRPLDAPALRRYFLAFPWMSLRTLSAIYWQALRLLFKRTSLHDHQASQSDLSVGETVQKDPVHARTHPERH